MKVVLDLAKLHAEGHITAAELGKLSALAARETGSLAINILTGFGVVAVSLGVLALAPTPVTALGIGVVLLAGGLGALLAHTEAWLLLANMCTLVGALLFAGGVVVLEDGSVTSFLVVTALFAVAGSFARSGLLIVGAVLALSCCIGVRTGYLHAAYFLGVQEPMMTVVLFSAVALATYHASRFLPERYEGLALVASRASIFLVNVGFWVGSLWGDRLAWLRSREAAGDADHTTSVIIGADYFALVWAVALIAVAVWAMRANRRWLVNLVAVFGAIHFYTQWFERLGATPSAILFGGLLMLAFAFGLWHFNRRPRTATASEGRA